MISGMNFPLRFLGVLLTGVCLSVFTENVVAQQMPTVEWATAFLQDEGTGGDLFVFDVAEDASGNTYVTGRFSESADFDPSPNNYSMTSYGQVDMFLAKYNASGALVYAVQTGSAAYDMGLAVAVDDNGNAYVSGFIEGDATVTSFDKTAIEIDGPGGTNPFFAKYDAAGQVVFVHSLTGTGSYGRANGITIAPDGSFIVVGEFGGTIDFNVGSGVETRTVASGITEGFIAKYDEAGVLSFVVATTSTISTRINSIDVDENANMIVGGTFSGVSNFDPDGSSTLTSGGAIDIFFARYDYDGNYVYRKGLRGSGSSQFGYFGDIALDTAGNVYLTGNVLGTYDIDPSNGPSEEFYISSVSNADVMFFAKYNVVGQFQYAKDVTGDAEAKGIDIGDDDQIYITGYFGGTVNFDGSGGVFNGVGNGVQDVFVASYNNINGNISNVISFGGSGADGGEAITVNNTTGKIKVVGAFKNTVDFDPTGLGTSNLTAGGSFNNGFIGQYSSIGHIQQVGQLGRYNNPSNTFQSVSSVKLDDMDNIYIGGLFSGSIDFDPSIAGNTTLSSSGAFGDLFLAKYDKDGTYQWVFSLTSSSSRAELTDVQIDSIGNVYIIGEYTGSTLDLDPSGGVTNVTNSGSKAVFLAKYSPAGSLIYANGFQTDNLLGLAVDKSGNAVITGSFGGTLDINPGGGVNNIVAANNAFTAYVAKFDPTGALVFANSYGGVGNSSGYAVAIDKNDGIYVTGFFDNMIDVDLNAGAQTLDANDGLMFVAKYDKDGNYVNAFNMANGALGTSIAVDDDLNIIVSGLYSFDVNLDPAGSSAGEIEIDPSGTDDIFLAKYTSTGALVFANGLNGPLGQTQFCLAVDKMQHIYIAGSLYQTVDFDPSSGVANLTGVYDNYIAKYSPSGNYIYAVAAEANSYSELLGLDIDDKGGIFVGGYIDDRIDLEPGAGIYDLSSNLGSTGFFAKYVDCEIGEILVTASGSSIRVASNYDTYQWLLDGQPIAGALGSSYTLTSSGNYSVRVSSGSCTASSVEKSYTLNGGVIGVEELEQTNSFTIYPNPSTGFVTIELNQDASMSIINVLDLSGRVVQQIETDSPLIRLDLSASGAGVYFVEVANDKGKSIQKLVLTE